MAHSFVMCFELAFVVLRIYSASHIMDNEVVLFHLIDEFLEEELANPELMLYHQRAFVFCSTAGFLFAGDHGFGDLSLCLLINQMEVGCCIGGLVLAETLRSLAWAALGFEE